VLLNLPPAYVLVYEPRQTPASESPPAATAEQQP
jgi:hypothetical protein